MKELKKHIDQQPSVYDPRPQWMIDFQNENRDNSGRFKKWAKETLTIDINKQLAYDAQRGGGEKAQKVLEAITTNSPFMLYQDPKHSCLVLPKFKAIITIFPGSQHTVEMLNEKQFQNRVKQAYVIYPYFEFPCLEILRAALKMILASTKPTLVPRNTL